METDQLEAFNRVAREGSFSRAALALGIGQPAVSARIQSLEEAVGGALFTRGRTVSLTALGETFLPYARRVLEVLREGVDSTRLAQVGRRGRIRLGSLGSLAGGLVGPALVRFLRNHGDVEYLMRATDHESLLELLGDGIVDLALVTWPCAAPAADSLSPIFVFRESVVLAAGKGHDLARRRSVSPDDVARLARPLLRLRWWPKHDPHVTRLAERSGTVMELPMEVARSLVLEGVGAGFFARTYVSSDLAAGALVEIPVRGMTPLHRDVALVRRRGTALSPAAAGLVQALRTQAERLGYPARRAAEPRQGRAAV